MNKMIVLDGFTLNPGDLSWKELEKLGELIVYDRTSPSEIIDRCLGANVLLTNKTRLDRETIFKLPLLKYIGVLATGYNIVDIDAAKEKGIIVSNVPAYSTHSVAQLTFGLLIDLFEDLSSHLQSVKSGDWTKREDFSYTTRTIQELAGKTIGIIGYGQIAKQVIKIARAFEMDVLVYTSYPENNLEHISFVGKEKLFTSSDIISIHTSLRSDNEGIINRENLAMMKPGSFIVNTSRGGLINEADLAEFLNEGLIAGAALDVLSVEPPNASNPLLKAKNCRITPHIAWATLEARQRLLEVTIKNIKAFQEGHPVNVVN